MPRQSHYARRSRSHSRRHTKHSSHKSLSLAKKPKHKTAQTRDMYVEHHPSVSSALTSAMPAIKAFLRKNRRIQPVVIFDLDETLLKYIGDDESDFARTFPGMRSFMENLRGLGVEVVYITARRERGRRETLRTLRNLKLSQEGDILLMKPDDFPSHSSSVAKRQQREQVARSGRTIVANVGDQMSDMLPKKEWKRFIHHVVDLPDCALRRSIVKAAETHDNVSDIIEEALPHLNHTLLFVRLEPEVLISIKMPSTFTTH